MTAKPVDINDLRPRPVPALNILFNHAAAETYAAPKIDPVQDIKDGKQVKIDCAFRNENGDTIFTLNEAYDWYLLPKDATTAYSIDGIGSSMGGGGLKKNFGHELDRKNFAELRLNNNTKEFGIAASFEKKGGFDVQEIELLTPYTDAEKAQLLNAVLGREISFIGMPEAREIEQAMQIDADGGFLIVSCNKADYSSDTLRLFTGYSLDKLKEIPVTRTIRYMDGGTTFYETPAGILFAPSGIDKNARPKWQPITWGSTPPDREISSWNKTDFPAQTLSRLNAKQLAEQIDNPRISGIRTWAQLQEDLLPKEVRDAIASLDKPRPPAPGRA